MAKVEAEVDSKQPLKMKRKPGRPKKLTQEKKVTKLEIKEDAVPEQSTGVVDANKQTEDVEKVEERASQPRLEEITKEEVKDENENKEIEVIEEKPVEEVKEEPVVEPVVEQPSSNLPENVDKLIKFMEETGGTFEDYVTLNKDYSKYDDKLLIREYYKKTRPHLDDDEINFVMQDNFSYDEEVDEERFVRKQKLAYKEEVAKAKNFLEQRYSQEQQQITTKRSEFVDKTKNFFQEQFKGFEFNVGEKAFRYNVSNPQDMISSQTDVSKFINKFMDKNGNVSDMEAYHKAIYAARNADRLAQHFYEQGKADATRDVIAKSKNISNDTRPVATETTMPNGWKVRAISGVDNSKLKIKKKS